MRAPADDVTIVRAELSDIPTLARLYRDIRRTALPYLPELHSPEDDLDFFRHRVFPHAEIWVAKAPEILGLCVLSPGWVDQLYITSAFSRRGLGRAFIAKAMETNDALQLWVFQRNVAAIRFYEAMGFRLIRTTDGSNNEEREPDALFGWQRPTIRPSS